MQATRILVLAALDKTVMLHLPSIWTAVQPVNGTMQRA